jgi:F-type H+-transporting ATPase subunit gamma
MLAVLSSVAARIERTDQPIHPLLAERPVKKALLVLITSDRGLAGPFNANLIRAAQYYISSRRGEGREVFLVAGGRKGRDFFRRRPVSMIGEYVKFFGRRLEFSHAQELAARIIELYAGESVDAVDFIYNEFKSVLTQRVRVERFLPVKRLKPGKGEPLIDYIYEQPPAEIFKALLPHYVETEVYRALLESQAAEFAARMTAMDAATNNAGELIDTLTLNLNRVRQAAITKEIIEIVSGASAE